LLATAIVVAALLVGVFPTRTYLAQRASISRTEHQLKVLRVQNEAMQKRIETLNTDAEIEQLAREQYNLVRPGEESYAMLPPPPAPLTIPDVWPFSGLQTRLDGTDPCAATAAGAESPAACAPP